MLIGKEGGSMRGSSIPAAGTSCEGFSGNDLGESASQKPWQPAFVLVK